MEVFAYSKNGISVKLDESSLYFFYNNPDLKSIVIVGKSYKLKINFTHGMRLIFFRDIYISNGDKRIVYNVGYQKNVNGRNVKVILKCTDDNIIVEGD